MGWTGIGNTVTLKVRVRLCKCDDVKLNQGSDTGKEKKVTRETETEKDC